MKVCNDVVTGETTCCVVQYILTYETVQYFNIKNIFTKSHFFEKLTSPENSTLITFSFSFS